MGILSTGNVDMDRVNEDAEVLSDKDIHAVLDFFWKYTVEMNKGHFGGGEGVMRAFNIESKKDLSGRQYDTGIYGSLGKSDHSFHIPAKQPETSREIQFDDTFKVYLPQGGDQKTSIVAKIGEKVWADVDDKSLAEFQALIVDLKNALKEHFALRGVDKVQNQIKSLVSTLELLNAESVQSIGVLKADESEPSLEMSIVLGVMDSLRDKLAVLKK